MSERSYVDSQPRCDARVGFMYGPSYLLPSYNSLWWAAQSLTWSRLLCLCHWGDLIRGEATRIPQSRKTEIWGAEKGQGESDLWCLEVLQLVQANVWVQMELRRFGLGALCALLLRFQKQLYRMLHSRIKARYHIKILMYVIKKETSDIK